MPTQPPPDRKKRMLIALIPAVIVIIFMGNFIRSILKDLHRDGKNGDHGSNVPLLIFGGFFLVMVLAVVISVVRGIRKMSITDSTPPPREDKPWLKRADWAAGKIKSSSNASAKFLWLWSVLALAMSAPAITHLPQELHNGNYPILLVNLFPIAAFCLISYSIAQWRSHRRFGDCFFELAQIPAPLGGSLDGMIQTGARIRLEQGLHLKLSCIRRVVTGSGKNQSTQETILWQDEKILSPNANLPEPEPGHSGIPVFFKLPADQPESYARGRESVSWRLEAKAKMSGPNFSVVFDVPVFQVAGAAIVEQADEPDPTAALQMSVEELRRDEHSRIQVNDVSGGREFYFPPARNPGTACFMSLFMLVFNGAAVVMYRAHAPILFPIVFGLIGVLLILGTFNSWLKSSRVTIDPDGVTVVNRWLIFSRARKFDAGDIARLELQTGMTSGTQTFQDIKLITNDCADDFATRKARYQQTGERPPLKFKAGNPTIASNIASKPEADWLVHEMTKALGRQA
jgi:hypothetical protein